MKNTILPLLCLCFPLMGFLSCLATTATPKVATVNIIKAMAETEDGMLLEEEFQIALKAKQKELDAKQAAYKKLKGKAAIKAGNELREFVDTIRKELDAGLKNNRAILWEKMRIIIRDMALDGHFDLILNDGDNNIVYGKNALDLTDQVIEAYDRAAKPRIIGEEPVIN